MTEYLTKERANEMLELMRDIMDHYCPYEKEWAYKLLEKLSVLQTNINRDAPADYIANNKGD